MVPVEQAGVGEQCVTFMQLPTLPTPLPVELNSGTSLVVIHYLLCSWYRWYRWFAACTATLYVLRHQCASK